MSSALAFRLPYYSGAGPSRFSYFLMTVLPRCLLCMLDYMLKISMGSSPCWWQSLRSVCISRSRPRQNNLGEYPLQHGKLNLLQPISISYGSRASILPLRG